MGCFLALCLVWQFFSLFIISSHNSLLRCMGHIINLAQQAFICALTGGTANLEEPKVVDNEDEDNLLDPEESFVGALIRPLLAHVWALVVWVSIAHCTAYKSNTDCLDLKVSWCKGVLERLLWKSIDQTAWTCYVWKHMMGLMAPVAGEVHRTLPGTY